VNGHFQIDIRKLRIEDQPRGNGVGNPGIGRCMHDRYNFVRSVFEMEAAVGGRSSMIRYLGGRGHWWFAKLIYRPVGPDFHIVANISGNLIGIEPLVQVLPESVRGRRVDQLSPRAFVDQRTDTTPLWV
jgi:hypothetical protein